MGTLSPDELYVIVSSYWDELTETAIAAELSEARELPISRDWVQRNIGPDEADLLDPQT